MYEIAKTWTFSAAHRLDGMPEGHPCACMHGHNYKVTVFVQGELDETAMVLDYRRMDVFGEWIKSSVDHQVLNMLFPQLNPTAERLAHLFYTKARLLFGDGVVGARVSEGDNTYAEYRRDER